MFLSNGNLMYMYWRKTMPKKKLSEKNYVILDTETTGLDPQQHEILEFCLYFPYSGVVYKSKVKPKHIENAHPKALEVNGYKPEEWQNAPHFESVVEPLCKMLYGHIVVGHNVQFDLNMIKGQIAKMSPESKEGKKLYVPYHCIDTVTLAQEHLVPMGLESVSLDNIRKFLGFSKLNAHTAEKDVKDTHRLFRLLFRAGIRKKAKIKLMHRLLGRK